MIKLDITIDAPDFRALSDRELRRIHKEAGDHVMEWFIRERLPKRFDGSLADQLHWKQRDPVYLRHKAARRRGSNPMYYTGRTLALFRRAVARVTPKFLGFKVNGLGPQFGRRSQLYQGSKNGVGIVRRSHFNHPDLRAEISRLTDEEITTIGKLYVARFIQLCRLALSRNRRHITIR